MPLPLPNLPLPRYALPSPMGGTKGREGIFSAPVLFLPLREENSEGVGGFLEHFPSRSDVSERTPRERLYHITPPTLTLSEFPSPMGGTFS